MDPHAGRRSTEDGLSPRMTILLTTTSFLVVLSLIIGVSLFRVQTLRVGSGVPGGTLEEVTPSVVRILSSATNRVRFE